MSYNPLVLGAPLEGENAGTSPSSSTTAHVQPTSSVNQLNSVPESSGATDSIPPTSSSGLSPVHEEQNPHVASPPQFEAHPMPPHLPHTRTAPTTFPVHPVAHMSGSTGTGGNNATALRKQHDSDEESPTPTLDGSRVPLEVGGLHGLPMPGSKRNEQGIVDEKDFQAGTTGGKTGKELAEQAAVDLGLSTIPQGQELGHGQGQRQVRPKRANTLLDEKRTSPFTKLDRTATGTNVHRHLKTGGADPVQGFGMTPLVRQPSQPPAVSPWGGVAPTGPDAEEGLWAVRSHEEEVERQAKIDKKGPDPFAVRFEPGEKENPKNWGVNYRWFLTGLAGLLVLNSTFASSSPSGIVQDMEEYFGYSQEVGILTISLFVAGYCVGPLLWGPLSETYGRRPIFIITFIVYTGFQVGCALSRNTASILIFRFLGGIFASAPLTNSGALLADIWDGDHRGQAMSFFSLAPFAGPSVGPIVAGAISVTGTNWRWVYWILTIFAGVCLTIIIFCVPETYAPALLVRKAKKLRKETGDDRYYAPLERSSQKFSTQVKNILFKPFIMLALEPMLMAVTMYMSFVYGVVYLLFEAFPFVFVINHGFNNLENGLCFLGFFLGGFSCVIFFITIIEPRYQREAAKLAPLPPKPEKRLELCIISGWAMVIAMFWFGWTSYSSIHWISPVLAGSLLGFSVLGMFVSLFNYIVDVYLWVAASALAGTTVARSLFGAAFPLFASQMYEKLGPQWASSLLGFLALLMAPIPIILTIFGAKLRGKSRYSPNKTAH